MKQQELDLILSEHKKWLIDSSTGSCADLSYANLSHADLSSADLSYANLSHTNLSHADLSYANLRSANLSHTNLRSANLSHTNLRSANLSHTNLSSADDKWVCDGKHHQITNIGSENGVLELYSCAEKGWLVRRGCFLGSKKEFIDAVKKTHGNNEHAIKYIALIDILTK